MSESTLNVPVVICPVCGGENEPSAIFCANPECRKALGEFQYALEALGAKTRWHEALANRGADFIGKPHFVAVHIGWIAAWVMLNTAILAMGRRFDAYPFGLLGLLLSFEAILITSVLIIGSRSQSKLADKRAELDYIVNVQTYREIREISRALDALNERLESLERKGG